LLGVAKNCTDDALIDAHASRALSFWSEVVGMIIEGIEYSTIHHPPKLSVGMINARFLSGDPKMWAGLSRHFAAPLSAVLEWRAASIGCQ
jgi:hypothetical protein